MSVEDAAGKEQTLGEIDKWFLAIIEHFDDVIVCADAEGKIAMWNAGATSHLGYQPEEIVGKPLAVLFASEANFQTLQDISSQGNKSICNQIDVIGKGKNKMTLSWRWSVVKGEEGGVLGLLGIGAPVSAPKQWKPDIFQSAKLNSAMAIASLVGHEIRNTLAIISASAQLLLKGHEEKFVLQCAKKIHNGANRAARVVNNLLELSRRGEQPFEEVDVNEALEEIISLVEHQALLHNIRIEKTFFPDLPLIKGNKQHLQQVFLNIITNALRAMSDGGWLDVRTGLEVKKAKRAFPKTYVEVVFADTGCGITQNNLKKIFEPFFTTSDTPGGMGLGLSISQAVVKQHEGEILVESEVGQGTTFTVLLPISVEEAETSEEDDPTTGDFP